MDLTLGLIADVARFHTGMASAEHDVEAFAGKTSEAEDKSGSFFNGMLGAAATGGVAAIGAGLLAVGGNALDMAGQVRQGAADAQAALGLTQGQAQDLANTAVTIFGQNWGDSISDVNSSLVTVRQQMKGLADSDLPSVTESALALRDTFGVDVSESTNAANTLMSKFGLTSKQAFDFITAGEQKGLNASGDFLDTIGEYSTQFAAGGATADQFFSLLQSGMQGGVLGTDKAADAFKEFRVRIQDGSKTTAAALTAIGINQEQLLQGMETGAISAADAFTMVQEHLNATTDTTVRMQAGVGLLGTQFEDLGTQGALALSLTGTKMGDLAGATDSLNAKYTTLPSLLEGGMRQFQTALLPVADLLLQIGNQALPIVSAAIGTLAGWLTGAISTGMTMFNTGLGGAQSLMTTLADPINIVIGFVTTLVSNVNTFFNTIQSGGDVIGAFGTLLSSNFTAISTAAGDLVGWIANTGLPMFVQALGEWANAFVSWIGPKIPDILAALGSMVGTLIGWLVGTALPAIIGKLAEWGAAFVAWIGPQIPPMLAQLSVLAGQLWDWMTGTALPNIMQKLGQWGAEFVAWIGPQIPPMLGALAGMLAQLAGWLLGTALPTIIGKLLEWGVALVTWVAPRIPELIGALGGLLAGLGGWLIGTALPAIITQLAEWGKAFLDWIGTSVLPFIGEELGKVALALYTWITQTRDAILGKAGEIGGNLVAGIRQGVADAWQGFLNWVGSLAAGLPDPIKQALGIHSPSDETATVGDFIMQGLQVGIEQGLPAVQAALTTVGESVVLWGQTLLTTVTGALAPLAGLFTDAGTAVYNAWLPAFAPGGALDMLLFDHATGFFARIGHMTESILALYVGQTWVAGLESLQTRVTGMIGDMVGMVRPQAQAVGEGIGAGMVAGIDSYVGAIAAAAAGAVQAAIDAANSAAQNHSPSHVFAGIGGNMGAGMAVGLSGKTGMVAGAAGGLVEAAVSAVQGSASIGGGANAGAAAPTMASARPVVNVYIDNGNGYEAADPANVRYVLQEAQYQVTAASRAGVGSLGGRL